MYDNFLLNHETSIPIPSAPVVTATLQRDDSQMLSQMEKHFKEEIGKHVRNFNNSRKTRIAIMWILLATFSICSISCFVLGFVESLVPYYVIGTFATVSTVLLISFERVVRRMIQTTKKKERIREIMLTIHLLPASDQQKDHLLERVFELNR